MTKFLGWYLAAVLAAYSLSASWSLGIASERVAALERTDATLASDLAATRARLSTSDLSDACRVDPRACLYGR